MEAILLPSKIEIVPGESDNVASLVVEPCFHGYGMTIGNALRRVMLSSLPGAAVTSFKIKGVQHEFSAMDGVKEDVLEIALNLKMLRLRHFSEGPVRLTLKVKGEKVVTAGDFDATSEVEIVNPDLHIATLTDKKSELEMEVFVEKGRGYRTTEERAKEKLELGMIAVDSVFAPLRDVGFHVENVRVGQITNFDKLVMSIETDGTISPKEAVDQSVKILLDHFNMLSGNEAPAMAEEAPVEEEAVVEEAAEEAAPEESGDEEDGKKKKAKKAAKKK